MKKQVVERGSMKTLSGLPQPILHHILTFLPQEEAVRTCVLSKSWRYVVSTRPNLEFRDLFFKFQQQTLMFFLDKTLRYYSDQKLSVQKFVLDIPSVDPESKPLLEKWIPILLLDMGVKSLSLFFSFEIFDVPSVVFKAESLEELVLYRCKLTQNPLDETIHLKQLRSLHLNKVDIAEETFHNIMSSCALIESVTLHECGCLSTIKVNKSYNLKRFDFRKEEFNYKDNSIEIDVPTIETIKILVCKNWYHHDRYFPRLKSLYLHVVQLSEYALDSFSSNFPCLKVLTLNYCYGYEVLQLSSRSIEHLNIWDYKSIGLDINAPNLLKFDYKGILPKSISVKTTSSEWKSSIGLSHLYFGDQDGSSWLPKLHEMLKALSQSEISLDLPNRPRANPDTYGDFYEPVHVGHLQLNSTAILDGSFCICRPRTISQRWYVRFVDCKGESRQLIEYMWKVLILEREKRNYLWQKDLEEVSMEVFDWDAREWHPVVWTGLLTCAELLPENRVAFQVRFRLKWRN